MANQANRVVYLSYDGLTDPLGQSQILPYILGLETRGFEFTIVSFEKTKVYEKLKDEIEKGISGKRIKWIPLPYHKNPPVLSTLMDIWFLWRAVMNEHNRAPFGIVHCRSYITSLVGLRMKRRKGVKFIFDMRGFWADERIEGGLWNLNNVLYKLIYNFFKGKEKSFLQEANEVVSLTNRAKLEILSWKIKPGPITVIPTCADGDLFDPGKIEPENQAVLRQSLGISNDEFILLYVGSLGTWYLYSEMVNFFLVLKRIRPNSKFVWLTPDRDKVQSNPDFIVKTVMRNEVPLYLSIGSALICFVKPSFSKIGSSATKINEALMMNRPVIVNVGWGDVENRETKNVILVKSFTEESYQEVIDVMSSQHEVVISRDKEFLLIEGVDRYAKIYERISTDMPDHKNIG